MKVVKMVAFAPINDIYIPTKAVAKNARAQFVHLVQNMLKLILVDTINYDDHFHPPTVWLP
jgi:hypothetical protein